MSKSLKIGGNLVKVKIDNTKFSGAPCGQWLSQTNEILINGTYDKQNQETTLIHEIVEAINYLYELNLEHNKIQILEATLYQVLKDNKMIDFSRYIP